MLQFDVPSGRRGNRELLSARFHADGRTITAVATDGTILNWFSDDRRGRFERWYAGREEQERMDEVLAGALLASPRAEDLGRTVQGLADLEPDFRLKALAEAEWLSGMPEWVDAVHRDALTRSGLEGLDLDLMLTRVQAADDSWPRCPRLILTHGATLVRMGRYSEAEQKLREALRVNNSEEPPPQGLRLGTRDRQVRRLLLVLALAGRGEAERAVDEWRALERDLEADASLEASGPLAELREEAAQSVASLRGV